ncbi:hypothetical protein [Vagococcus zengguangii]|uniref:Uncharacterized protein n=1 Tax=Vagococcus zengguangii TaxID=2571750 RepID=A0A4D7CRZ0_9ENTE|nr:hypothetical protein [Vagococcus zengguangii]QCI86869.1 hypothetical protein FA707_07770 [Vagococcus zengguangii]TLG80475.1 hypothetical protein FE258_05395 [Vagococcus zengguangii]
MVQIICSLIILGSSVGYLILLGKLKRKKEAEKVLSYASQVTFSCYLLSFAVYLFYCQTSGITVKKLITAFFVKVAFICVVHVFSILYYRIKLLKKPNR